MDSAIGQYEEFPLAGVDQSKLYCSRYEDGSGTAVDTAHCVGWVWWARVKLYTIEFDYSTGYPADESPLSRSQFAGLINTVAAYARRELP